MVAPRVHPVARGAEMNARLASLFERSQEELNRLQYKEDDVRSMLADELGTLHS